MMRSCSSLFLLALSAGCMLVAPLDEVNTENAAGGTTSGGTAGEESGGTGGLDAGGAAGSPSGGTGDVGTGGTGDVSGGGSGGAVSEETGEELCWNWEDDDQDGDVDCSDLSCCSASFCSVGIPCGGSEEMGADLCSNGRDDDGDSVADCADLFCCVEVACAESDVCASGQEIGEACNNGLDDDFDEVADCDDSSCCAYGCELSLVCTATNEETFDFCWDELDNDNDNLTDCEDPDCCATYDGCAYDPLCAAVSSEICGDGVDNDRDGYLDCEDRECCGTGSCDECLPPETGDLLCSDGEDNDLNGYSDCDDPICCTTSTYCAEMGCILSPETDWTACTNSLDDDGDGGTDCGDPECRALEGLCEPVACAPANYPATIPIIDDFEDSPDDPYVPGYDGRTGSWYAIMNGSAEPPRVLSDPTGLSFYLHQDLPVAGDRVGVDLLTSEHTSGPCPYDASQYQGFSVAVGTTNPGSLARVWVKTADSLTCSFGVCPRWEAVIPDNLSTVSIFWLELIDMNSSGSRFDASQLVGFEFYTQLTPADLVLDDLQFIGSGVISGEL